jgi:hypothetical protein
MVLAVVEDGLVDDVADTLAETGLPAQRLRLRLSEGSIEIAQLARFARLGVELVFSEAQRADALQPAA